MGQYPDWLKAVDDAWSLFLDRDGTINVRLINDYVKTFSQFTFLPNALEAIEVFSQWFQKVIIVTNQQGVGKGLMTQEQLNKVHDAMIEEITNNGGYIDQIFSCTQLADEYNNCRKPNPNMAFQAEAMFPELRLEKSIMIGDMPSDIEFGNLVGMKTVYLGNKGLLTDEIPDLFCDSLWEFMLLLQEAMYAED